jgi:hypothetical protein
MGEADRASHAQGVNSNDCYARSLLECCGLLGNGRLKPFGIH